MSQNDCIHGMVVSRECSHDCGGTMLGAGLEALSRAREETFFAAKDEKLIAQLRVSLGLPALNKQGQVATPCPEETQQARGTGYGGSHCELTRALLNGYQFHD